MYIKKKKKREMSLLSACMADFSGLLLIRSKQFFFSCVSETASVNHTSHACCKNGGTSYVAKGVLLFDRCVLRDESGLVLRNTILHLSESS